MQLVEKEASEEKVVEAKMAALAGTVVVGVKAVMATPSTLGSLVEMAEMAAMGVKVVTGAEVVPAGVAVAERM